MSAQKSNRKKLFFDICVSIYIGSIIFGLFITPLFNLENGGIDDWLVLFLIFFWVITAFIVHISMAWSARLRKKYIWEWSIIISSIGVITIGLVGAIYYLVFLRKQFQNKSNSKSSKASHKLH